MRSRTKALVAGALACLLTFAGMGARAAHAQTQCAPMEGGSPALGAIDAETRLAFIRGVMRDQASRTHTWTLAWSGIGFALAAGQYALVPLVPAKRRFEEAFEGTAALYIPASIAVLPLHAPANDATLEQAVDRATASGGVLSPCLILRRAEELLELTASDEGARTSVLTHVVTFFLNAGYAAIIGFGFQYIPDLILSGTGAFVIGELELLTIPRGAIHALENYRHGEITAPAPPPAVSFTVAPLGVAPGLSLVGRF